MGCKRIFEYTFQYHESSIFLFIYFFFLLLSTKVVESFQNFAHFQQNSTVIAKAANVEYFTFSGHGLVSNIIEKCIKGY